MAKEFETFVQHEHGASNEDHARSRFQSEYATAALKDIRFKVENGAADLAAFAATTALTAGKKFGAAFGIGMWGGGLLKAGLMQLADSENADFNRDFLTGAIMGISAPVARAAGRSWGQQAQDLPLQRLGKWAPERVPGMATGAAEGAVLGYATGFDRSYAFEYYKDESNSDASEKAQSSGFQDATKLAIAGGAAGAALKGSVFQFRKVLGR
jgi:hypothetical protein